MVKFAVFGDVHGKQDLMYKSALNWEKENNDSLDFILQVGDFETIRNNKDYSHYYAPSRRHKGCDFPEYFSGIKEAPILTIFTGGNHEAWTSLREHRSGGFICPNIYYIGRSGSINVRGIEIAGLTGIYNKEFYKNDLSESVADNWKYYRKNEVENLLDNCSNVDILLLHEWIKPYSLIDVEEEDGVPESFKHSSTIHTPISNIISTLDPKFVFMGHMDAYLMGNLNGCKVFGLKDVNKDVIDNTSSIVLEL